MKLLNPFAKVLSVIALCVILFAGCKKNDSLLEPIKPPIETPPTANDAVKVAATVTGTVIDENNLPVANAAVTAGSATTTTDAMGNFSFRNIVISVANGSVTVNKAGYFKGIRNFVTEEGKNNYVKIQLLKQVLTGTITAAAGGSVTANGAVITFPANAFETTAGAAYTGNVKVYATWIDPTAANLPLVVPGDLRGINSSNGEYLLKSYGMVGAELKDDNGNTLKIATGKTAGISFPIPSALQSTAPATIPLWHFDESTNRWREEGTATKTGNNYVGQVNKFSFWNVDVPANFIYLNMRLLNSANSLPLANTMVKVTSLATNTYAYDFTNDSGFVAGYVPKNEYLKIEVIAGTACNTNTVVYTQNAGPYTANTYLGDISVSLPANTVINFTGTVKGCNNMPVSNGYVSLILANGTSTLAYTNASGVVNFSLISCGGTNTTYTYTAVDLSNGNYSNIATGTTTGSNVNLGTIAACGNTINTNGVYIAGEIDDRAVVWKDGVPTFLTAVNNLQWAYAKRVVIYNNDLYVLIIEGNYSGQATSLKYSKNGSVTNIVSGQGINKELDFCIFNGDVYACYTESISGISKVWKNGVITTLPNNNLGMTSVSGIRVVNGDTYVSGGIELPGGVGFSEAILWKNNILTILPRTTINPNYSHTTDIFVEGNDVYVSGSDSVYSAGFWKNGIFTNLPYTSPYNSAHSYAIYVQNNDVYVAGIQASSFSYHIPTYWKNGSPNIISTYPSSGNQSRIVEDIFVKNNIVYTIGHIHIPSTLNYSPIYFQNNLPIQLNTNNSQTVKLYGIFVL